MSDLCNIILHHRKRLALLLLVACTAYAFYLYHTSGSAQKSPLQNVAEAKQRKLLHQNSYDTQPVKSGNLSVHILSALSKAQQKSRTSAGIKNKNNMDSDVDVPDDVFDVFRTNVNKHHKNKHNKLISESASSWSSADMSSDSSSIDDKNVRVEDDNILDKPALKPYDNAKQVYDDTKPEYRRRGKKIKPSKKLPQALIIGVKKAGTRALLEFIRLHPAVKVSGPEVHYFDKFYENGPEWYRDQMPETTDDQVTMEKSPGYFPHPDVPKRVYKMNKNMKLIVIFREPVSRLISDYAQSLTKEGKKGKKPPLADQVFENYRRGIIDTTWSPVVIGRYAEHLERWLSFFPIDQFVFLNGDNFTKNPAKELVKVQEFLGLDVVIDDSYFYFNETKGFPCATRTERKDKPKCLGDTKGRAHPDVDPYVITSLQAYYKPYNQRLYEMTGINFNWENHTPKL